MTPKERAQEITLRCLEGENRRIGWNVADELDLIEGHINEALKEQREAIAKMVENSGWRPYCDYCKDVYPKIAKDIREGKTCDHQWTDARNKYVQSGEFCRVCYALREGNESTDKKAV